MLGGDTHSVPACSLLFLLGLPGIQSPHRFTWEVTLGSMSTEQSRGVWDHLP